MPETTSCTQIEGIFVGLGVLAVTPRQNGEEPRPSLGAVTDCSIHSSEINPLKQQDS